ncbi:MAG: DNA-binding domain-containing protein [Candidatus Methylomirabilia bacterium]
MKPTPEAFWPPAPAEAWTRSSRKSSRSQRSIDMPAASWDWLGPWTRRGESGSRRACYQRWRQGSRQIGWALPTRWRA